MSVHVSVRLESGIDGKVMTNGRHPNTLQLLPYQIATDLYPCCAASWINTAGVLLETL